MNKFTPGPWTAVPADEYHGHYVEDETGETVCDLYFNTSKRNDFTNAEANARLIAAAPDLLEALIQLEAYSNNYSHDSHGHKKLIAARNAIAKAIGGAP